MDENTFTAATQKWVQDNLRTEFDATLEDRVSRYLEVKPHEIVPNKHFAPVSSECALLFRDGHYYSCIALTQAVAEALVRFICETKSGRAANDFTINVRKLSKRGHIPNELESALLRIWEKRHDFHHLNSSIESDRSHLMAMARERVRLLQTVEKRIFAFDVSEGKMIPKHPEYWDQSGDTLEVYLRFEP